MANLLRRSYADWKRIRIQRIRYHRIERKSRIWRAAAFPSTVFVATLVFLDPIWFGNNWLSLLQAGAAIGTALIILVQARLLRIQNQVSALITLTNRWESTEMLRVRARWGASQGLPQTEPILEFLVEFAALSERGVLDEGLIWDSVLGWYAAYYFAINNRNGNIAKLRLKWKDPTLYRELRALFRDYASRECGQTIKERRAFLSRIQNSVGKFIEDEKARYQMQIS